MLLIAGALAVEAHAVAGAVPRAGLEFTVWSTSSGTADHGAAVQACVALSADALAIHAKAIPTAFIWTLEKLLVKSYAFTVRRSVAIFTHTFSWTIC